jgi:hypothetical protein
MRDVQHVEGGPGSQLFNNPSSYQNANMDAPEVVPNWIFVVGSVGGW